MNKTVLITGASKGIGLATAREFLTNEPTVSDIIMLARESDHFVENVKWLETLNDRGVRIHTYNVDLGDRQQIIAAMAEINAAHPKVDILVNNAGYTNPVAFQQVEFEDFEKTIMVNVYAPFTVIQELLHHGNKFDAIVNIASTAGITGRAGWLTYSASKAAVINMSDVLREELAIYGTRVVSLSPGRCATDLRKTLAPDEDPSTIMQPEHVASIVRTMVSGVGQYLDSANLVVRQ
ncbi:SDR family oxidoreductase [Salinibacterium sp. UTAS2018]|uniref:SDR family NAD(P)-dependent oxidoreductase n=1 Tax=Salinibacterium sp. UTAS2018 TaxID=2508880 RepID=UPI0010093FF6|nr:SDR family oxidoreductase [Salinibacterium sp. UTAS2018]QAV69988.1 SDR family oxidoreductase [Salinibacterium sp. UTAS2018]